MGEGSQTLGRALEVGLEGLLSSSDRPVQVEVKVTGHASAHTVRLTELLSPAL